MANELRMGHLRGIVMRAPGMTETADFYTDLWGLDIAHRENGIVYLHGTGPEPFLYGLKDDDVYGIEYIHFGQPDRATIDAFHEHYIFTNISFCFKCCKLPKSVLLSG